MKDIVALLEPCAQTNQAAAQLFSVTLQNLSSVDLGKSTSVMFNTSSVKLDTYHYQTTGWPRAYPI